MSIADIPQIPLMVRLLLLHQCALAHSSTLHAIQLPLRLLGTKAGWVVLLDFLHAIWFACYRSLFWTPSDSAAGALPRADERKVHWTNGHAHGAMKQKASSVQASSMELPLR